MGLRLNRAKLGNMEMFTVKVEKSGRILIPASVRRKLHIEEGSQVILTVDNRGVQVGTREQALENIQRELRKYIPRGKMLSEELLADRRREAARENASHARGRKSK